MINNYKLICKLDVSLYSCISTEIDTDIVVLMDKSLIHISDSHPEALKEVLAMLSDAIKDPDYIFEDNRHPDTGLVIKCISISKTDENICAAIKVCTNTCGGKYANSVITGWKISKKRLDNYIRNRKILYKRV